MSFVLSEWGEGIRPYDFDLPYGYGDTEQVFHTMFDRALVRQGETIHMKHIVRMPVATGFAMTPAFKGTLRLSHRGSDTQFELPLTIDANGRSEEHTSELQSLMRISYAVFCLKKKTKQHITKVQ